MIHCLLLIVSLVAASVVESVVRNLPVSYTARIIDARGRDRYEQRTDTIGFTIEIISDTRGMLLERAAQGEPFVAAQPDERYAIKIHNPLPVRVAVNLSVDGINTITGKPAGITDGRKWVVPANSHITIRGWQVNSDQSRRFFFTQKRASYAAWQGERLARDLAGNCGVIGAAFFWSTHELNDYYFNHPIVKFRPMPPIGRPVPYNRKAHGAAPQDTAFNALEKQDAGTGMGEREAHPTISVRFDYDAGMYCIEDAVHVYYDFAPEFGKNPFPGEFAEEMNY